jgi:tetratricopeptide (TPR) repeat protein
MRLLLVAMLVAAAGCATTRTGAGPVTRTPGQVSAVGSEDEYTRARAEYEALPPHDSSRPSRRAALEGWLLAEVNKALDGDHLEDAWEKARLALTLYDPAELHDGVDDPRLRDTLARVERAFSRRGSHEEVITSLVAEMALTQGAARAQTDKEYRLVTSWVRLGGADEGPAEGRERLIDDLEAAARLWPSPFVVGELTTLYFERARSPGEAGKLSNARRRGGQGIDERALRELLQSSGKAGLAYDLARLYLRVSTPQETAAQLKKIAGQPGDDPQLRGLIEKAASPEAQAGDEVALAALFILPGRDDRDVALRVCEDAARRFPNAAEPRLCAGKFAFSLDRLVVALRNFEEATRIEPDRFESWELLAKLYQQRLFQIVSDENLDVKELDKELAKVERFHAEADKKFPGKHLRPDMGDALFEVARGYFNAGRIGDALTFLDRALALSPSPLAYELKGQIHAKKGDAAQAVALFNQGIEAAHPEKGGEGLYVRAKLRRELADALEAAGNADEARTTRKAAIADWDQLVGLGLTPEALAEAGLEKGKMLYQLGRRDEALEMFGKAIDAAPDRGSTYADSIAWLVARGELEEALDAYHRALGRNEVTDYLKVYCSLWMIDLARRAGQPVDPLATAYLKSTDGAKWYDDLARWATGRETEAKMMAHADTPARKAEVAFYRGMRAYGEGRTDEARTLWKQVVDTDMMAFFEYDMAQLYLKLGGAPAKPLASSKSHQ